MKHNCLRAIWSVLVAAALSTLAPSADAATLYVANNGMDSYVVNDVTRPCGAKTMPCRSISQAIANAVPNDTIIVGPGRYGDLNSNGTRGDKGEERGGLAASPECTGACFLIDCDCMLLINKDVTIVSSDGAAATVIDARNLDVLRNVFINAAGATLGGPGQGFTVTRTKAPPVGGAGVDRGILIDARGSTRIVTLRGNQIVDTTPTPVTGLREGATGILVLGAGPVLIEANQLIGWQAGILVPDGGSSTTIKGNHVILSGQAIITYGAGDVVGNVATANIHGITMNEAVDAVGNALIGNLVYGISVEDIPPFSGIVARNNLVGNGGCGLHTRVPSLAAANNWWGAATGPGPEPPSFEDPYPPDAYCDDFTATSPIVTPFAPKPFTIAPIFRP